MAAAAPPSEEECPVCHDDFTDPKILSCLHLVCRDCIVSWLQKGGSQAGCPICRAAVLRPKSNGQDLASLVDDLPTDIITKAKVDSRRMLDAKNVCICNNSTKAASFCMQCSVKLCPACVQAHKVIPSTREHEIEPISTLTVDKLTTSYQSACAVHPGRQVEQFCSSHQELICINCSTSAHRGCPSVEEVAAAAMVKRQELKERARQLEDKKNEIQKQILQLDNAAGDALAKFKAMKEKVKTTFDELHGILDKRCRDATAEIQKKEDDYLKENKSQKQELEKQRARSVASCNTVSRLVSAPDDPLLAMLVKLKSHLDDAELLCRQTLVVRQDSSAAEPGDFWFDHQASARLKELIATHGQMRCPRQPQLLNAEEYTSCPVTDYTLKGLTTREEVCLSTLLAKANTSATLPQSEKCLSRPQAAANGTLLSSQTKPRAAPSTDAASIYRVKVSGVPPGTSADCLQNYLECVADVPVSSISLSKGGASAVVTLNYSDDEPDLDSMTSVCRETPLEEGKSMSFQEMSPSHTVRVTGLVPKTADDAVQFFFSNKRRNNGGPVEKVERSADKSSALVHFKDPKDAEAVVKKGKHILDGRQLLVALHDEMDDEEPDGREEESFVSSIDRDPSKKLGQSSVAEYSADQKNQLAHHTQQGFASGDVKYAKQTPGYNTSNRQLRSTYKVFFPPDNMPHVSSSALVDDDGMTLERHTRASFHHAGSGYPEFPKYTCRRQKDSCKDPTNRVSGIIASFQSPKINTNEFIGDGRAGSTQYSSGNNRGGFEQGDLRPPAPSSAKTSLEARGTNQEFDTMIKLGARVMRRIQFNLVLLKELITKMKAVGATFRWKEPDQMLVKCLLPEPTAEWEKAVHDKVKSFLSLLAQHERQATERYE